MRPRVIWFSMAVAIIMLAVVALVWNGSPQFDEPPPARDIPAVAATPAQPTPSITTETERPSAPRGLAEPRGSSVVPRHNLHGKERSASHPSPELTVADRPLTTDIYALDPVLLKLIPTITRQCGGEVSSMAFSHDLALAAMLRTFFCSSEDDAYCDEFIARMDGHILCDDVEPDEAHQMLQEAIREACLTGAADHLGPNDVNPCPILEGRHGGEDVKEGFATVPERAGS